MVPKITKTNTIQNKIQRTQISFRPYKERSYVYKTFFPRVQYICVCMFILICYYRSFKNNYSNCNHFFLCE